MKFCIAASSVPAAKSGLFSKRLPGIESASHFTSGTPAQPGWPFSTLADSAAEGGLRRVTADLCRALLVDPVRVWTGSGPAAQVCLGAIWDR